MVSLPPPPLITSESSAPLALLIVTCSDSPLTTMEAPSLATLILSLPSVPLTVTVSAGIPAEVDGDLLHVSAGQVVDHDGVGAARALELDTLDAIEVHGDVALGAGKCRPAAIGRNGGGLINAGATEVERVETASTLNDVAAVALIPDEQVIAGAQQRHVAAAASGDRVVAGATGQQVVAVAARNVVIAAATVDDVISGSPIDDVRRIGRLRSAGCRYRR